jgi:hypothetical protein
MGSNITTSQRSKQVTVTMAFVAEFLKEKLLEIKFVRKESKTSNGFTENLKANFSKNIRWLQVIEDKKDGGDNWNSTLVGRYFDDISQVN